MFQYLKHVSFVLWSDDAHSRQAIIVKCNISFSINVDEKYREIHDRVVFLRSQHSTVKFTHIRFFMRLSQFEGEMFKRYVQLPLENVPCEMSSCIVTDKLYMFRNRELKENCL